MFFMPFLASIGAKAAAIGITKATVGKALLSTAASAIMSKAGGGAQQQTTTSTSTSRTNFQQMRDDAEAAGFNPLTALRMTGAAGNVTTTGTSVINTPALSSRDILGRAIGAGLNSLGKSISSYDPLIEQQKKLNIELSKAQLAEFKKPVVSYPPGITPPGGTPPMVAGTSFADRVAKSESQPNAYDPRDGWSVQPFTMADGTQPISEVTNIGGVLTSDKIKAPLYTYVSPNGRVLNLPWEEPGIDEIVGGVINYGVLSIADAAAAAKAPRLQIQEYLSKWKQGGYTRVRTPQGWAYQ